MPKETTPAGVTPADAVLGQFFYAIAHEVGHAMFDLLNVPIFGHQEDAADQFAGYIILQFGKADAPRLILGAVHSYNKYVKNPTVTAPLTAFSDERGLRRAASRCKPRAMFVGARESIRRLFASEATACSASPQ
jgi:Putative metallopeptidase